MNIREAMKNSPRALVLGFLGWVLNVLVTAFLCKTLLGWRLLNGLLLGSIIGGSSSIIVIALARKLGVDEKTETVLSLESILTDVLCTVGAFAAIDIILSGRGESSGCLRLYCYGFRSWHHSGFTHRNRVAKRSRRIEGKTKHIHVDTGDFASHLCSGEEFGGGQGLFQLCSLA
jgi:hypothetical protein